MIIGIGTDLVEVERIKDSVEKYGKRFLDRIFTETEQKYSESFNENKYEHFAARFAAKESFSKAIGTGITRGFKFREFGVKNDHKGKPLADLSGGIRDNWGSYKIHISLSHTRGHAIACVVIETKEGENG